MATISNILVSSSWSWHIFMHSSISLCGTPKEATERENNQPHIVLFRDEEEESAMIQYFVCVEQQPMMESANVVSAVFLCLVAHYIFNLTKLPLQEWGCVAVCPRENLAPTIQGWCETEYIKCVTLKWNSTSLWFTTDKWVIGRCLRQWTRHFKHHSAVFIYQMWYVLWHNFFCI